jgi:threonylcarbamoyladenosine tRNA methylthiotransferase MtaB
MYENKRIAFYTLGCKVNQYETQMLSERFLALGFDVVAPEDQADIYVINSCTVTGVADRKSRNYARRSKRLNPEALTALVGCYAETARDLLVDIEEIDLIVGSSEKDDLARIVCKELERRNSSGRGDLEDFSTLFQGLNEDKANSATSSVCFRGVTGLNDRTRAYIKIEDGCDRYCAYCIIPYARGAVRSRPLRDIVYEAEILVENGYRELVLTGVNAALYGADHVSENEISGCSASDGSDESGILRVVDAISKLDGDFRIRLSSLEPTVINADYAKALVRRERLCPHLHLSLQSGSDRVLEAMGRGYRMDDYLRIVDALKSHDPDYSITTDLIVGFPGETDVDFEATERAVNEIGFSNIHVFKYSRRRGTAAATMKGQVAETIKTERSKRLIEAGERAAARFVERNIGKIRNTLFYGSAGAPHLYAGITDNGIMVSKFEDADPSGQFLDVRIDRGHSKTHSASANLLFSAPEV